MHLYGLMCIQECYSHIMLFFVTNVVHQKKLFVLYVAK